MKKLLPEVCTIQYGFPFDSAKFSDSNGMPLIRIRDVVRGYSETYTTEEYKSEYIVHENDLLIGMDGEFNIAKWGKTPALLNQRVCRLAPNDSIDKGYLFYFMPVALKRIEEKTPFVTVKHLSAKELNKIEIPVLSLEEQRKIAETLSKVDELIAFREQQLAKLDELVKARFVEMFGVVHNSVLYPYVPVESFTSVVSGGTPNRNVSEFWNNGSIRWVKTTELQNNVICNTDEKITQAGLDNSSAKIIPPNTVLIAMYGQGKTRGMTGYTSIECATNQACACILPCEQFNQNYLWRYMILSYDKLRDMAKGGNQPNLNIGIIKNFPVLKPPIELQNDFAAFVERVDQQKQTVQQSLEKLELMKKALMQEYFG